MAAPHYVTAQKMSDSYSGYESGNILRKYSGHSSRSTSCSDGQSRPETVGGGYDTGDILRSQAAEWGCDLEEIGKDQSSRRLLVSGLPNALLGDAQIKVMLQGSGFIESIRDYRVKRIGKDQGQLLLFCDSVHASYQCQQFFNGCTWARGINAKILHEKSESDQPDEKRSTPSSSPKAYHESPSKDPAVLSPRVLSASCWLEEAASVLKEEKYAPTIYGGSSASTTLRGGESDSGDEKCAVASVAYQ